ncbi:hypothetical protein JHV675_54360 [Mycobacterium avium subsp. hominissuis]
MVFVEVKTRTGDGYGGLPQAVTPRKVRRLRRLAGQPQPGQDRRWAAIRIDVIGVRVGRRRTRTPITSMRMAAQRRSWPGCGWPARTGAGRPSAST